jgi:hypothetical protein
MRVLNISSVDYANMSHNNAQALRSIGIDCDDWTMSVHAFQYTSQSQVVTAKHIMQRFLEYDVIQLFHSCEKTYMLIMAHPNIVVYHTGTRYRMNKRYYDNLYMGRTIATDQCEFLLHDPTMMYVAPHTTLQPAQRPYRTKLRIAHYPSNHLVKGTKTIQRLLEPFKDRFEIDINTNREPHEKNLYRIGLADIYIELFNPTQNGQPYGCFGVTAFEATAMGVMVVTNNVNRQAYEDVYGAHPFLTPNDEMAFIQAIESLAVPREQFDAMREEMHAGFRDKHSIQATGERIKQIIDENYSNN